MEWIDGEPVLDRPSVGNVEEFFESAGPDTRAVWVRLTRKGVEPGYDAPAMRRHISSATRAGARGRSGRD